MEELFENMDRQYRTLCMAFQDFQLEYLALRKKELKKLKKLKKEGDDE